MNKKEIKSGIKGFWGAATVILAFGLLLMSSCLPDVEQLTPQQALDQQIASVNKAQLEADLKIIDDSLVRWGLTASKEPNGVRYLVQEAGTGAKPTLNNIIVAKYTGKLLKTGAVFAPTDTITIHLYDLIVGWQTTLPYISKGSKVTLYIPSGYGYGAVDIRDNQGAVLIPRNSNLIFDIELLDVK